MAAGQSPAVYRTSFAVGCPRPTLTNLCIRAPSGLFARTPCSRLPGGRRNGEAGICKQESTAKVSDSNSRAGCTYPGRPAALSSRPCATGRRSAQKLRREGGWGQPLEEFASRRSMLSFALHTPRSCTHFCTHHFGHTTPLADEETLAPAGHRPAQTFSKFAMGGFETFALMPSINNVNKV